VLYPEFNFFHSSFSLPNTNKDTYMASKPAEFGVSSSKFGGQRGGRGRGRARKLGSTRANTSLQQYGLPTGGGNNDATNVDQRFEDVRALDQLEMGFGFERYQEGLERLGWLLNMHEVI
jgi:DNA polymerase epsilon subunit 1